MALTLAQQLENVEAAIAAIVTSAQSVSVDGQTLNRADLRELRNMRRDLLNEIDRADRGRTTVAEF